MTRLSAYLVRLFASDAAALFAVALFLLFLIQCLRMFDVVAVKGQDLLTLAGQALLIMPTMAVVFLYISAAIGLGRGLRALQASQELHIIHVSRRAPALLGAVLVFIAGGMAVVLVLSNFVKPATQGAYNDWSASVAADVVGRALTSHRFTEVVPGVTIAIGERGADGELREFFADDRRDPETRRTYVAASALVASDEEGYVLQLRDGAIQYMTDEMQFSAVSFQRYDLAMDRLTGEIGSRNRTAETDTVALVAEALAKGDWKGSVRRELGERMGEGIRLAALCLFVAALMMFPHSRRAGREVPIEIVVLVVAFIERGVSSSYQPDWLPAPVIASFALIALSVLVLLLRFRAFSPQPRRLVPT
jgi:lipopolysaccharide export system permease protein